MDRAVLDAYGWHDLAARAAPIFLDETNEDDHTYQGRLFWPSDFRDEVLARLLALNAERHAEEVRLGIAPGMKGKAREDDETRRGGRRLMPAAPATTSAAAIRGRLVDTLRRDLIGPGPDDADLARERLKNNPSRWYLAGFLAPALDGMPEGTESLEDEGDPLFSDEPSDPETGTGGGRAADDAPDDEPSARKSRVPSSCGLTVLVDASVREVEVTLSWGDYVTVPPLPDEVFIDEKAQFDPAYRNVQWQRVPGQATLRLPVPENGRGRPVLVPGSAGAQRPGGALVLEAHARPYTLDQPDGTKRHVMALTVMVVNRRNNTRRRFSDVTFAFQVRLEVRSAPGSTRAPMSPATPRPIWMRPSPTCTTATSRTMRWAATRPPAGRPTKMASSALPIPISCPPPKSSASSRTRKSPMSNSAWRRWPRSQRADRTRCATASAISRRTTRPGSRSSRRRLPASPARRVRRQRSGSSIPPVRRGTASPRASRSSCGDRHARLAFRAMNEAVARAARQREAGQDGDPSAQRAPRWRPFQLAFILLNLSGLQDRLHPDREVVDLLFFPTGGGKTEAYLGLAAWTIAHRRITNGGTLGAGVAVLMRYTLRLLTLDQLSRASGVVCALELMRGEPAWQEGDKHLLGDWPIEIGLWVGSAASPNRLGKTGDGRKDTAVARVRRYRRDGREAPAPIKACPWCATPFSRDSFACIPTRARAAEHGNPLRKPCAAPSPERGHCQF